MGEARVCVESARAPSCAREHDASQPAHAIYPHYREMRLSSSQRGPRRSRAADVLAAKLTRSLVSSTGGAVSWLLRAPRVGVDRQPMREGSAGRTAVDSQSTVEPCTAANWACRRHSGTRSGSPARLLWVPCPARGTRMAARWRSVGCSGRLRPGQLVRITRPASETCVLKIGFA